MAEVEMASQRFELQRLSATHRKNVRLEEELAPAVLEAGAALWREYSELSEASPAAFPVCGSELLAWYAELQYKTRGGSRCSQCRAPVRHALKVRAEREDRSTRTYVCLCTRCLVAEEALAKRVLYRVAGQWVEKRRTREKAARRQRRKQAA